MKSAHSCTLSNVARHFSTCCVYFLYLGSDARAALGPGTTRVNEVKFGKMASTKAPNPFSRLSMLVHRRTPRSQAWPCPKRANPSIPASKDKVGPQNVPKPLRCHTTEGPLGLLSTLITRPLTHHVHAQILLQIQ